MDVYAVALTASEKRLVRKALAAYEPENTPEQTTRQSCLELLKRPLAVANTDDVIEAREVESQDRQDRQAIGGSNHG